jgi:hypothetical protein
MEVRLRGCPLSGAVLLFGFGVFISHPSIVAATGPKDQAKPDAEANDHAASSLGNESQKVPALPYKCGNQREQHDENNEPPLWQRKRELLHRL